MTYDKSRYLKIRETLPRMYDKCGVCGKKLERFGERKQVYFCSDHCAEEHRKKYKKQWEKDHIEKIVEYRRNYYLKQKNARKKNKPRKLQKVWRKNIPL